MRYCAPIDVVNVFFDIDTAVPLGLIINELVSNSLKYAFPNQEKGVISISLHEKSSNGDAGEYSLYVKDDGVGFPRRLGLPQHTQFGTSTSK
jgi:two-component sensor histidine kinase